jgi:hypothetical protein
MVTSSAPNPLVQQFLEGNKNNQGEESLSQSDARNDRDQRTAELKSHISWEGFK